MSAREGASSEIKCVVWTTQPDGTLERTGQPPDIGQQRKVSLDGLECTEFQGVRRPRDHDLDHPMQQFERAADCWSDPDLHNNPERERCSVDYEGDEPVASADGTGPCLNDSEGYSSMEGSRSSPKTSRAAQSPSPCCVHCGRTQGDWTPPATSPPLSSSPVPAEEGKRDRWGVPGPVVVEIVSKEVGGSPADQVTVRVMDHFDIDNGTTPLETTMADCHAHEDHLPTKETLQSRGTCVNLEGLADNVTARVKKPDHEGEGEKVPVPPARLRRRQSLLNKRQKLIDLLTSRSVKRGPQVKTIKKTIRRILRGSELTDEEEEEIVEEITEEVFGVPALPKGQQLEPKNGSVTRTVRQTKDGRHILTTTYVQNDQHNGREVFNGAFD